MATPLIKKLGIKENFNKLIINEPINYYDSLKEIFIRKKLLNEENNILCLIHLFVNTLADLEVQLTATKSFIHKDGMI